MYFNINYNNKSLNMRVKFYRWCRSGSDKHPFALNW